MATPEPQTLQDCIILIDVVSSDTTFVEYLNSSDRTEYTIRYTAPPLLTYTPAFEPPVIIDWIGLQLYKKGFIAKGNFKQIIHHPIRQPFKSLRQKRKMTLQRLRKQTLFLY